MRRRRHKAHRGLGAFLKRLVIPALAAVMIGVGVTAAVTVSQRNTAPDAAAQAKFDQQDVVVYAGDSITWGAAASDQERTSRPGLMAQQLGESVYVVNQGVNGWKLVDVAANIKNVEALARKQGHNVVILHAGSNDLAQGASAADLLAVVKAYVTTLTGEGWRVAVGTVLRRDLTPTQERERVRFNTLLRGPELRAAGATVIDYATAQATGAIPLADGVHPGDVGYAAMNRLETPFISAALEGAQSSN